MGMEALRSWNGSTSKAYANLQTWHSLAGAQPLAGNFPPATSAPGGTTHVHVHLPVQAKLPLSVLAHQVGSVQSLSRVRLHDPMNRRTPGLPVHHQLPEFTQTQIYRVGDAIQPSHPLASPSPPAPNPSQHQSLFQ